MKSILTNIDNCIMFQRGLDEDRVYVICNMSDRYLNIELLYELDLLELDSKISLIDNITGSILIVDKFQLNPYQVVWVSLTN